MARARNRNAVTLGLVGGLGLGLVSAAWFAAAGVSIPDLTATAAAAGKTEIMPLSEIRPGMKGHAMTVFYGSTPERFEIEPHHYANCWRHHAQWPGRRTPQ